MIRTTTPILTTTLFTTLALLLGCGDARTYPLDPGSIDWDTVEEHAGFDGAEVQLTRYSSECARASSKSLSARVGAGTEFRGDVVATLDLPCDGRPTPSVDVHVERSKLMFDFSSITHAGHFSAAEFDGFVMDVALHEDNALLIGATLDRERTTVALEQEDIYFEPDYIEINFEGVSYDDDTMVEIKLWFANVDPHTVDTN